MLLVLLSQAEHIVARRQQSSQSCRTRTYSSNGFPFFVQGAHDTIESLQTKVLDLEIDLKQAKAALADTKHAKKQDTLKLQQQLRQAELKVASGPDSDSALKALTLDVSQLRSELQSRLSDAAAVAAAAHEAVLADKVSNLQEKLQQAEAKAAASVDSSSRVAEMTQEMTQLRVALSEAQDEATRLQSSADEAEEQHQAALQASDLRCMHPSFARQVACHLTAMKIAKTDQMHCCTLLMPAQGFV